MATGTSVRCPACKRKFRVSREGATAEPESLRPSAPLAEERRSAEAAKRPPPLPPKRDSAPPPESGTKGPQPPPRKAQAAAAPEAVKPSAPPRPDRRQSAERTQPKPRDRWKSEPTPPDRTSPPEPPPPEPPRPAVGVEIPASQRQTAYFAAGGLAALAALSLYPGAREIFEQLRRPDGTGIDTWAWLTLALGLTHLAYGLYLAQLPDWSAALMTLLVTTLVTAVYAAGLGLLMMARGDNATLVWLGLADELAAGYARPWCLAIASLYCVLAIALIRITAGWHKRAQLLARTEIIR